MTFVEIKCENIPDKFPDNHAVVRRSCRDRFYCKVVWSMYVASISFMCPAFCTVAQSSVCWSRLLLNDVGYLTFPPAKAANLSDSQVATTSFPGRAIAPQFDALSNEHSDVTFLKVDIDAQTLARTVQAAGVSAVVRPLTASCLAEQFIRSAPYV